MWLWDSLSAGIIYFLSLSLVGGYSEMVCSLNRPILSALPVLTWPWTPFVPPVCPTWRSKLSLSVFMSLYYTCGFVCFKSFLIFRRLTLRLNGSLHSSAGTHTSVVNMWMDLLSQTCTRTCCPYREEPKLTASSTWPCRPASTMTSQRTSNITAWAPGEKHLFHYLMQALSTWAIATP